MVKPQYDRQKGAEWFPLLYKKDILVLGQGGIGSWVSFFLGRIGATLHIYDMDIYESHNMTGQMVLSDMIGAAKVDAVAFILSEFSPDCKVFPIKEEYDINSPTNNIVICGFDDMIPRKIAFTKWKNFVNGLPEEGKRGCFFQDGRLSAEQLQIFSIPGERADLMEIYEKEHLFNNEDAPEQDCTFKQTSHCAAIIAGYMTGFITNWIVNSNEGRVIRQVPFMHQYFIPANFTSNV
jgi:hypothetical protein